MHFHEEPLDTEVDDLRRLSAAAVQFARQRPPDDFSEDTHTIPARASTGFRASTVRHSSSTVHPSRSSSFRFADGGGQQATEEDDVGAQLKRLSRRFGHVLREDPVCCRQSMDLAVVDPSAALVVDEAVAMNLSANAEVLRSLPSDVAESLLAVLRQSRHEEEPTRRALSDLQQECLILEKTNGRLTATVEQAEMRAHRARSVCDARVKQMASQASIDAQQMAEAAKHSREVEAAIDRARLENKRALAEHTRVAALTRKATK